MVKIAIFVHIIISCLIIIGGYEAFLGFRQLYGFSVSNHSLYALTGSFYNPGPYMGYLAMVLPVCVYVFYSCHSDDCKVEESVYVYRSFAALRMTLYKGLPKRWIGL